MSNTIIPLTGWILDEIVELDEHHPGFAASYLRASPERRQVIAAFLAMASARNAGASQDACLLSQADHQTILRAAFGQVPAGLRGALRRSGPQPHNRRFYALLHKVLTTRDRPEVVRALARTQKIDPDLLIVLRKLPSALCRSNVAEAVMSVSGARDLTNVVGLLVDHGVDRVGLFAALRKVADHRQLVNCLKRWTLKVPMPPHPVPGSACYRPLKSAADLHRLATRYQNCLKQYVVDALNGYHAFAEVTATSDKRGLIVHLERNGEKWMIQGMFGARNSPPRRHLREAALQHLRAHGVEERRRDRSPEGPWSALTRLRLPGFYDFGF